MNEAAYGKWNDSYDSIGWSVLEVHTNPQMDDGVTAAAAGAYEGFVTGTLSSHLICAFLQGFCLIVCCARTKLP